MPLLGNMRSLGVGLRAAACKVYHPRGDAIGLSPQSIFRRSGNRFAAENATTKG
jgi:hypothetical protein